MNEDLEETVELTKIEKTVELLKTLDDVSPYELSKIATAALGRVVQGPMIYTYVKKNYIKSFLNEKSKPRITGVDAAEWLEKYSKSNSAGNVRRLSSLLDQINS